MRGTKTAKSVLPYLQVSEEGQNFYSFTIGVVGGIYCVPNSQIAIINQHISLPFLYGKVSNLRSLLCATEVECFEKRGVADEACVH